MQYIISTKPSGYEPPKKLRVLRGSHTWHTCPELIGCQTGDKVVYEGFTYLCVGHHELNDIAHSISLEKQ